MLSVREVERATRILAARLPGARTERIVQRSGTRLEISFSAAAAGGEGRERLHLVLSCDPVHGRVGEAARFAPAPPAPLAFAQRLRARLGRARVAGVFGRSGEREIGLRFAAREGATLLVLQLLGPRSNLYLLDDSEAILASLRPLDATRRDLAPGSRLAPPTSAPPAAGEDRFRDATDADFLGAVERRFTDAEEAAAGLALRRRVAAVLARERQRLLRREAALQADLARGRPARVLRREGELLKGALHGIAPGAHQVLLQDPETGETLPVLLDPALPPGANLERVFARYQRARRREAAAAEQLRLLASDLARLGEIDAAFAALEAGAAPPESGSLAELAARPEVARLLGGARARHSPSGASGAVPGPGRKPALVPARLRPGCYRTRDGLEVWVGRNAEGNDHLTTRMARGNDLFFHVEGSPGSHVVLRTAGRKEIPQESILEAAELAVHFSRQRSAPAATLHLAAIRDVRKPRGAKPGLVHVQRSRSLLLRRDAARLARILGARIEEDG